MDAKETLNVALMHRARGQMKAEMANRLQSAGMRHTFLSNEAQDKLVQSLRQSGSMLHEKHLELEFTTIAKAISEVYDLTKSSFPEISVLIPYDVDRGAAFLADTEASIRAIQADPFLISLDGFVMLISDASGGLIVDYLDVNDQSPANVTLLGCLGFSKVSP